MTWCVLFIVLMFFHAVLAQTGCCGRQDKLSTWLGSWRVFPTSATWSFENRLPMSTDFENASEEGRGKLKRKVKRKLKRFMLPLLLAYKLKFFTIIPVLIGGLVLLVGATGLAGFFFALFAAVMGLRGGGHH